VLFRSKKREQKQKEEEKRRQLLMVVDKKAKDKSKNRIEKATAAAAIVTAIGIFVTIAAASYSFPAVEATTEGFIEQDVGIRTDAPKAPMAASQDGNNIYVVWWTNRSGNWEVMFRASNDGGQTFGDKINLSNSPETQSQTAEILAVGNSTVYVTWWELNENVHPHTNESVLRVSTDGGQTFGPVINLGTNGTISGTEEGGEEGETVEEEAVGGEEVAQ
jgi:hypothetical protein